jgi:hypothetical protein
VPISPTRRAPILLLRSRGGSLRRDRSACTRRALASIVRPMVACAARSVNPYECLEEGLL